MYYRFKTSLTFLLFCGVTATYLQRFTIKLANENPYAIGSPIKVNLLHIFNALPCPHGNAMIAITLRKYPFKDVFFVNIIQRTTYMLMFYIFLHFYSKKSSLELKPYVRSYCSIRLHLPRVFAISHTCPPVMLTQFSPWHIFLVHVDIHTIAT